jgi:thiol:disulfide interchange protein DsbC
MELSRLLRVEGSMKIIAAAASAVLSLLLALPVAAQQDIERIKAELKKRVPEAPIESVRKLGYAGLYEVVVGNEVLYTDETASIMVIGSVVDLKTKENLTENRLRQVNKVDFAQLPFDSAIKIVRGNGSRKVAIFEDPNCGYCKRFERDLAGVSDITVYVFLYPILSDSSVTKSKAIWCSADRGKAWMDTMVRDVPVAGDGACATPVDKNLAFGNSKRIQGTPTIIFEDGERIPGVMAMADFEKKLASVKTGNAKSASSK